MNPLVTVRTEGNDPTGIIGSFVSQPSDVMRLQVRTSTGSHEGGRFPTTFTDSVRSSQDVDPYCLTTLADVDLALGVRS